MIAQFLSFFQGSELNLIGNVGTLEILFPRGKKDKQIMDFSV